MRKIFALLCFSLGIALVNLTCSVAQAPNLPSVPVPNNPKQLPPQQPPSVEELPIPLKVTDRKTCQVTYQCLGWDEQIWGGKGKKGDKQALLTSIDNSLRYLQTNKANTVYQNYPITEITLDRVFRSLIRFRQLVVDSKSPAQLQAAVNREFVFYKSVGNDGKGTVKFTAYYEPLYTASRTPTAVYKYPLYGRPLDFDGWAKPHPKRIDLEGQDGLLKDRSPLHGLELFWFRDRFEAYMIHIQGSAQLKLTDGTKTSVGFAGGTDYPWTSIGRALIKDGKLSQEKVTMPAIVKYFHENPQDLNQYLPRWERFIFFKETNGMLPTGSIDVPVTAERSIATDKSVMPPGAVALIYSSFPYPKRGGGLEYRKVSRFVLDQDTGSAIKGPGRVDYFMGTGNLAGDRAGVTGGNGELYYLLLKQ
ncbi:MAG: murein transglycosylase A [Brasilonema angustatum HA4187-MV1]|jgi:membrane-bound lytic murein transglycosylase A|nr:murein transglycosylase A [Brasilonema angustatum HA4187-MV1]